MRLPGMQIVGPRHGDDLVLQAARAFAASADAQRFFQHTEYRISFYL
jgi:Asp-tRNA(Asn)/Glu-tRNA(Gln) amidotransferase A subunit family amidase